MKGYNFVAAFVNEKGVMIWKSKFNPETEKIELYSQQLDNNNKVSGENTLRASTPLKGYSDEGDYVVETNTRQTHFVILYSEKAGKDRRKVQMHILNDTLAELNNHVFGLEFQDDDFDLENVCIDTTGSCFILLSGINPNMEKATPERIGIHIYGVLKDGKEIHQYMNFHDTYVSSPKMNIDEYNNALIVSGLYSLNSVNESMGILDYALDLKTGEKKYHQFVPYTIEFVTEILDEKAAKNGEEAKDFKLKYLIPRTDGGYILMGEEFSVAQQSHTYYVNGIAQMTSRSVYNYGKIFILSIDSNGQSEWFKVINKVQSSIDDLGYYSSYTVFVLPSEIHLLFNDKVRGSGGVMNYTLNNSGELKGNMLFGNNGPYVAIAPGEAKQLDARTILIPTAKDRKFAFVKLIY